MQPAAVLSFWFDELGPSDWYAKSDALDARIRERFHATWAAAHAGELFGWRDTPKGRLAEVIVLDQFSRNMFRDDPRAFAQDGMALLLAQEAVRAGAHDALPSTERAFLLLPYMHSESRIVHEEAVRLYQGLPNLEWELKHKAIIDRFGRYPHRNKVLGRASTPEEEAFLREPGSSF